MASEIKRLYTVADLESFPDDTNRYEIIGGELFVSRAPGISHQRVLQNLQIAFSDYLRKDPIGILVPGAGAVFSNYDAVIPDLAFVRNERWEGVATDDKFTEAVDLVIEIMSRGTANRKRDLVAKRKLYGQYGVEEYWIIDRENREVLVYRLRGDTLEEVAVLTEPDKISSSVLPDFELPVSTIFNL